MTKKSYEAPRIVAREDLKEITLYTGFGGNDRDRVRGPKGPRDLFWNMP